MKMNKTELLKKGQKASLIVSAVILALVIAKAVAGYLSDSSALIGDALHSGVDLVVMFASWVGLKISQREPTQRFPYGFYKAESLATLFISLFILYAAYELIVEGYNRLFEVSTIKLPVIALSVSLAASIVTIFTSRYLARIGREINADSLLVTSREQLMDAVTSIVVFISILLSYLGLPYVEGIATLGIAVLILRIGILSVKDAVLSLMDVSPSKDLEKKVQEIIGEEQDIEAYSGLKLRKSGPYVFGEVNAKLKKFINVDRAHQIADDVETKLKQLKPIDSFTVHVEPYAEQTQKVAIPVTEDRGLDSSIMEHFGRATFFFFAEISGGKLINYYLKENKHQDKEVRAGLAVTHFLIDQKANILITREIGEISFHSLRDSLIDVYLTSATRAQEIIDLYLQGKLDRLAQPTKGKD